jgi:hypothetical protein
VNCIADDPSVMPGDPTVMPGHPTVMLGGSYGAIGTDVLVDVTR